MTATPDYDTPRIAEAVEALPPEAVDALPFGAIKLDAEGVVRFYSAAEARLSGYGSRAALGRTFFADIAPCMNNAMFRGAIDRARRIGKLDIRFSFVGDFSDRDRELTVRVQSASDGGTWIFMRRPE